jgi:transcriptional regulator
MPQRLKVVINPMYVPSLYKAPSQAEVIRIIREYNFGILVTGDLNATHIPLDLETIEEDSITLFGHLSKANPQAKQFINEAPVLVIFSGPHTYISSSWYEKINVPTWNYVAVHVYGDLILLDDEETRLAMKNQLAKYESGSKVPVTMDQMPADFLDSHLKGITAFRIKSRRIESSFKLSQNRNDTDYGQIISELKTRGDEQSLKVAGEMARMRDLK